VWTGKCYPFLHLYYVQYFPLCGPCLIHTKLLDLAITLADIYYASF
jgi:hypothetical protein